MNLFNKALKLHFPLTANEIKESVYTEKNLVRKDCVLLITNDIEPQPQHGKSNYLHRKGLK